MPSCEVCNKYLSTEHGLHQHYGKIHPDFKYEKGGTLGEMSEEQKKKISDSLKKPKVELICEICGESFKVMPSHTDERRTCGKECFAELQQKKLKEKNPAQSPEVKKKISESKNKGGKTETECVVCGKKIYDWPSKIENRKTCSKECQFEYISENFKGEFKGEFQFGEDNPAWNGGTSFEPYDSKWTNALKNEVRKRDNYECQFCGMSNNVHILLFERSLHVHHVNENKKESNKGNLITLCQYCHNRWHGYLISKKNQKASDFFA